MSNRPVLRAASAALLAAAVTATTVLPATAAGPVHLPASPGSGLTVPASPGQSSPTPAEQQTDQPAAKPQGQDRQIIDVEGVDPQALPADAADAAETEAPESPAPESAESSASETADTDTPEPTESEAPESEPAESNAPETEAPETESAESEGPVSEEAELAETALAEDASGELAALTVPTETIDFVGAGLTWDLAADQQVTEASLRVRENGTWGEWNSLSVLDGTEAEGTDRTGTEPLLSTGADAVQARVLTEDGTVPEGLELTLIDPGTASTDGTATPAVPAGPAAGDTVASTASLSSRDQAAPETMGTASVNSNVLRPAIVTRAQWGANESWATNSRVSSQLKAMYVHHTAGTNGYTRAQAAQQVRAIYDYHARTLRWGDIGYQFLVDKFGTIYEGRRGSLDRPVIGAQAGGFNTNTIGVSAMGNYDVAAAPAVMVEALKKVLAWQGHRHNLNVRGTTVLTSGGGASARYPAGRNVTIPVIVPHRETNTTACPGRYLMSQLPGIRTDVANRIAAAKSPAPTPAPALTAPAAPSYRLNAPGLEASASWRAVAGATSYQIMYRSQPHGGGAVTSKAWTAGRTTTGTSISLSANPGETAQFAVRAVRNGVAGPQTYLGQHTGPLSLRNQSGLVSTTAMESVSHAQAVGGTARQAVRAGSAVRIYNPGRANRLILGAQSPRTVHVKVTKGGNYLTTVRVPAGQHRYCGISLPSGGNDVYFEVLDNVPVTFTSAALVQSGQSQSIVSTGAQACQSSFADNAPGSRFAEAVDWMWSQGLTNGYSSDNTFRKDRNISRGESVAFIHRYVAPNSAGSGSRFSDVPASHTFHTPVMWARAAGITQGYSNGTFGVNRQITRGEFASFLYRAADPRFTAPRTKAYPDVDTSNAHHPAIAWMKSQGLVGGYADGSYRPNQSITRGEVAVILHRYDTKFG